MKVFLLHADRDFEVKPRLRDEIFAAMHSSNRFAIANVRRELERRTAAEPGVDDALIRDLELDTLWSAMADGDEFIYETVKRAMLSSLIDAEAIVYRQRVLEDALEHPQAVRDLYALALDALAAERKVGSFWHSDRPDTILYRSVQVLTLLLDVLERLRALADEQAPHFASPGFRRFFAMLQDELTDEYLATIERHLSDLEFKHGLLESARLTQGNRGTDYVVRRQRERHWTERLPFADKPPSHSFTIPPRDEAGFRALEDLRGRGLNHVANAVAQSADHVASFFSTLRLELAFYLGCLNLHARLEPTCFPEPADQALTAQGLYDPGLALHLDEPPVGNDLAADGRELIVITGANQGGKSTLLRALGVAQLMLQCGMFVPARAFRARPATGVFTHFKREEDAELRAGKLDEELHRMSDIADAVRPGALVLCNESFAATNEREGSEIARQVVKALLERGISVVFVTHMYDLARSFTGRALFLRAERDRTFKLREAEPLPTSYGADAYRRVFGATQGTYAFTSATQ